MAATTLLGLPSEGEVILALRNMAATTLLELPSEGEVILALRNIAAMTVSEGEVILDLGRPFVFLAALFHFFVSKIYNFWHSLIKLTGHLLGPYNTLWRVCVSRV